MEFVAVRIESAILSKVKMIAKNSDMSVSAVIRQAIKKHIVKNSK